MARIVQTKKLENARLLKEYASWIYCTGCNKTIAYLCYVTYDVFDFRFTCGCGCKGSVYIDFERETPAVRTDDRLTMQKNRLCCPADDSPIVTFVDKNLKQYSYDVVCAKCGREYGEQETVCFS